MEQHLPALVVILLVLFVPMLVALGWYVIDQWRQRKARDAMLKGNGLYREWLDRSGEP